MLARLCREKLSSRYVRNTIPDRWAISLDLPLCFYLQKVLLGQSRIHGVTHKSPITLLAGKSSGFIHRSWSSISNQRTTKKKSPDSDNIHVEIIQGLVNQRVPELCSLYNDCFACWKVKCQTYGSRLIKQKSCLPTCLLNVLRKIQKKLFCKFPQNTVRSMA